MRLINYLIYLYHNARTIPHTHTDTQMTLKKNYFKPFDCMHVNLNTWKKRKVKIKIEKINKTTIKHTNLKPSYYVARLRNKKLTFFYHNDKAK